MVTVSPDCTVSAAGLAAVGSLPQETLLGRGGQIVTPADGPFVRVQRRAHGGSGVPSGMPTTRSISTAAPTASPEQPMHVRLGRGPVNQPA